MQMGSITIGIEVINGEIKIPELFFNATEQAYVIPGDVRLKQAGIVGVVRNLWVAGTLTLSENPGLTGVENVRARILRLNDTGLCTFPVNVQVAHEMWVEGTPLTHIPDGTQGDYALYADGSALKSVGAGVSFRRASFVHTPLKEVAPDFRTTAAAPEMAHTPYKALGGDTTGRGALPAGVPMLSRHRDRLAKPA